MLHLLAFLGVLCVSFVACAGLCMAALAVLWVLAVLAVIGGVMVKAAVAWLKAHHVWHTWGKWELYTYTATPIAMGVPLTSLSMDVAGQYRVCEVCGRRKSRDV